jgi:hypothetical protein
MPTPSMPVVIDFAGDSSLPAAHVPSPAMGVLMGILLGIRRMKFGYANSVTRLRCCVAYSPSYRHGFKCGRRISIKL